MWIFLLIVFLGWAGAAVLSHAEMPPQESRPGHGPGKTFLYTAKKFGLPFLKAVIKIENGASEGGVNLYQIQASVDSHFGLLFKMKNRFFSTVQAETCTPVRYIKEIDQKGLLVERKKYSQTSTFDFCNKKIVVQRGEEKEKQEVSFSSEAYDPLSMFAKCYLKEEIHPGQEIRMTIFDGVKLREMIFSSKKERVKSRLYGEIDTICLESNTSFSSFEDRGGVIRIWYTDNGEKIPVLIELELPVGNIKFELESAENS